MYFSQFAIATAAGQENHSVRSAVWLWKDIAHASDACDLIRMAIRFRLGMYREADEVTIETMCVLDLLEDELWKRMDRGMMQHTYMNNVVHYLQNGTAPAPTGDYVLATMPVDPSGEYADIQYLDPYRKWYEEMGASNYETKHFDFGIPDPE